MTTNLTFIRAGHEVSPEQWEPGVDDADQAAYHRLDFLITSVELGFAYQVEPWVGLEVAVPIRVTRLEASFRDQNGRTLENFESIHHETETLAGLGDVRIGAQFQLLNPSILSGLILAVGAGLEVPTGHVEPDPFELGRQGIKHQHMFFGSGTVNPYASLALNYTIPWFGLSVFGRVGGAVYENRYSYRGPTLVFAGIVPSTDFGLETFRLLAGVELLHEEAATWSGVPAENSGRTDLLASVGIQWQIDASWGLMASVRLPIYNKSLGGQLEAPFYTSLSVTFQTPTLSAHDHAPLSIDDSEDVIIDDSEDVIIDDSEDVIIDDSEDVIIDDDDSPSSEDDNPQPQAPL